MIILKNRIIESEYICSHLNIALKITDYLNKKVEKTYTEAMRDVNLCLFNLDPVTSHARL